MSLPFGVGDEAGVAEALGTVEEGELGPGVGTLPAHEQPGGLRPAGQRDEVGQLGHPGPVADRAVGLCGGDPVLFLDEDQGVTNSLVDGESDGEVAVGLDDGVHEPVGGPGRVGPHQDGVVDQGRMVACEVAGLVLLGQSRQRTGGAVRCGRRRRWPRRSPDAAWRPVVRWSCRTTRPTGRTRSPSCRWGWRPASPSTS